MAVLKAKRRNRLKASSFGLPGSRKYPMHDRRHAANAKARIHAKANRVLKRGRTSATRSRTRRRSR